MFSRDCSANQYNCESSGFMEYFSMYIIFKTTELVVKTTTFYVTHWSISNLPDWLLSSEHLNNLDGGCSFFDQSTFLSFCIYKGRA